MYSREDEFENVPGRPITYEQLVLQVLGQRKGRTRNDGGTINLFLGWTSYGRGKGTRNGPQGARIERIEIRQSWI